MANDSLSQTAKLLYDVDARAAKAETTSLIQLTEQLEKHYGVVSQKARDAAKAFDSKPTQENLTVMLKSVGNLGKAMRDLKTSGANVSLLSPNEVTKALALQTELGKLEKAFKSIQQASQIKDGTFGLSTGNIGQKLKDLKTLEQAQRALNLASEGPARGGLTMAGLQDLDKRKIALEENIRLIKLQTAALKDAALAQKGQALNETGSRQSQYKQVLAAEKQDMLNQLGQRQAQLKALQQQQQQADLNMRGQREIEYKRIRGEEQRELLNQLEQRRIYMRQMLLEQQQQYKQYQQFSPSASLRGAFGNMATEGASTFQRVAAPGMAPDAQIAQQRRVLELQNQIVERIRQGNLSEAERLVLVNRLVQEKRKESELNTQNLNQIREQEAAQRRLALASGVGAASLLGIQAALRVNGMILNGLQNSITQAVQSSIQLEAEFKNVQAVTATTNTEMMGLQETVKNVAGATKFSSKEVAEAALSLGQAGLSASETAQAIPAVAQLATAAGTSLAQAVSLTTSVLGIFDKQASETADIANKITQAANSSKVSVEKLALGFQYAGNIAHQSGVSFEETTAAMSAMSNAGILNGSTLGSGLRSFLTEVQNPSQEFIDTLHRIGLGLSDVDFKAHGLMGVTNRLREAGFVASDAIKSFDIRGAAAFNALVANPADLERQYTSLLDTSAAIKANAIQMDSLAAQSKRVQTSLENLAATGLAPLSQVLKDSANNTANFFQELDKSTTAVQVMTTALAVGAAVLTTQFLVSLSAGTLQLLGFQTATVASVRAIGTMTVAQGAAAAMTGLAAAVSAVASAGRALVLTAMIGGFSSLSAAAGTATIAIKGLGTAIKGMSLLTGLGVALALGAAAYYTFSYAADASKRAMDEATAASSVAKAAFDEKTKTVKSLDEMIGSLTYRQNILKEGTAELRLATEEANSKFGSMITIMDSNKTSADTLLGSLKKLRAEMQGLAELDLQVAIAKAEALSKESDKQAVRSVRGLEQVAGVGGQRTTSQALESFAKTAGLPPGGAGKLLGASAALKSGGISGSDANAITSAVSIISKALEDKGISLSPTDRKLFTQFVEKGTGVGEALGTSRRNVVGVKSLQETQAQTIAFEALKKQVNPVTGKGTIGDAIATPSALVDDLRRENPKASSAEIFDLTKKNVQERKAQNELLIKALLTQPRTTATDTAIQALRAVNGAADKQLNVALEDANGLMDAINASSGSVYKSNLKTAKKTRNIPEIQRLSKAEMERKLAYETRGETNPDRLAAARTRAQEEYEAKLEADTTFSPGRGPRSQVNVIAERTAKMNERAALAAAESDKLVAGLMTNWDNINSLFESGKAHIVEAGEEAKKALKAKQAEDLSKAKANGDDLGVVQLEFQEQTESLKDRLREDMTKYVAGFSALGNAASKRVANLNRDLKAKTAEIENLKLAAADNQFEGGARLRELQLQMATRGGAPKDVGPEGTLQLQSNRERLQLVNTAIVDNQKLMDALGDKDSGLIKTQMDLVDESSARVKVLNAEVNALMAKLAATPPGEARKDVVSDLMVSSATLSAAQKGQSANVQALTRARTEQQAARGTQSSLLLNREEIKQTIPVEFDYSNLKSGLDQGFAVWKQQAGNFDSIKTLTDGMVSAFEGAKNAGATFFRTLVDRSKSAADAFKAMATSIISSMLDIAAQMAAQQGMKAIIGLFGGAAAGAAGATAAPALGSGLAVATGGYVNSHGMLERVRHMATGGLVTGGIQGKDSVPALLMPGEMVLNKAAVDATGTDYLHALNNQTNSIVSSSTSGAPKSSDPSGQPNVVNVYVVTPDQKPTGLGANDVVAIVSDDILRGGSVKKLIKTVIQGG